MILLLAIQIMQCQVITGLRQMNEHGRAHDTDPDEADIWFLCHLSDSVFQKKYRQNETKVDVKSIHT